LGSGAKAKIRGPGRREAAGGHGLKDQEIQRALTLIGQAKDILIVATTQEQDDLANMPESDDERERAEDVVDALERAAMFCDDAITSCEEAIMEFR
jgi:hypothetical protein